ncbi:MAG: serine/threonine protein kinase [Alphaproteobacteria bacterium]|nr:serine/threonine protein kinase [Alphaproteobacteria bacterium]
MGDDGDTVAHRTLADGRYDLVERIGRGGVAEVWRAHDTALGVDRAIKILHGPGQTSPRRIARFRDEARAMAQIGHPNIVAIHDVGETEDGPFVVMELIEGGTLADVYRARGKLHPAAVVDVALDVLAALHAAHAHGIIHRDVKPSNILLGPDAHAHLADFGIALVPRDTARYTRTGTRMGSLSYMPPEQRSDAKHVGPPSDIYALASGMYEVTTGLTPVDLFAADEESPRWDVVPEALRTILFRATRYRAADRYASAAEMAAALTEIRPSLGEAEALAPRREGVLGVEAHAVPPMPDTDPPPYTFEQVRGRGPAVLPVLAIVAVVGLGVGAAFLVEAPGSGGGTPATEARLPPPAAPVAELAGAWSSEVDGDRIDLTLTGPDAALHGQVVRQAGEAGDDGGSWEVVGHHDPSTGVVELRHVDGAEPATEYHLRVEDGALAGVAVGADGGARSRVRFARGAPPSP